MRTPATAAATMPAAPAHSHTRRPPPRCAVPALVSVSRIPMIQCRSAGCGGSVWESNPPPTCLEPDAGFEVREAHRDPRRFRASDYPRLKGSECITRLGGRQTRAASHDSGRSVIGSRAMGRTAQLVAMTLLVLALPADAADPALPPGGLSAGER